MGASPLGTYPDRAAACGYEKKPARFFSLPASDRWNFSPVSYCLNPKCPTPDDPNNNHRRTCLHCGTNLLLQDRYRILRVMGGGGFGRTYEVDDGGTRKVLKVLLHKPSQSHFPVRAGSFGGDAAKASRYYKSRYGRLFYLRAEGCRRAHPLPGHGENQRAEPARVDEKAGLSSVGGGKSRRLAAPACRAVGVGPPPPIFSSGHQTDERYAPSQRPARSY